MTVTLPPDTEQPQEQRSWPVATVDLFDNALGCPARFRRLLGLLLVLAGLALVVGGVLAGAHALHLLPALGVAGMLRR